MNYFFSVIDKASSIPLCLSSLKITGPNTTTYGFTFQTGYYFASLFTFELYKIYKILPRFDFTVIYKPTNEIRFPLSKDSVPLLDRSSVNRIPTECGLSYIGNTKRAPKFSVRESLLHVFNGEVSKSAVGNHS